MIAIILFLFGCGESEEEKETRVQKEFDNCVQSAEEYTQEMCGSDEECQNKYYPDLRKSCLVKKFGCAAVTGSSSC